MMQYAKFGFNESRPAGGERKVAGPAATHEACSPASGRRASRGLQGKVALSPSNSLAREALRP